MRSWRASALVFGSSAAVLMVEIIAGRLMAPYVGVSLETFTGIIGTVLAGIALGAAVGGSLADRRDPRSLIGPTLVLGGVLTWASLPILALLGPAVGSGPIAIVTLTAAAFLAPCTVLSAVPPMIAKLRLDTLEETGSVVGGLSAAGTFGALVGTFLTGFVLVAALPSRPVVLGIGALVVGVGLLCSWRLTRSLPSATMVVAAIGTAATAVLTASPCERETAYFCVRIEVDPELDTGRNLILDNLRHAHADLADPTNLDIRYVRLFADVVDTLGNRGLDVVHLGGGGFTFPRYLSAVRPESRQLVLEIDDELPAIAEAELGFEPDDRVEVRIGDGRLAFGDLADGSQDLVVGDAFASLSVPWHLTTVEVAAEIRRVLRGDGVYVMNVIDGGESRFARAQLATLADRFSYVMAILPSGGVPEDEPVNQVLIASDSPLRAPEVAPGDGRVLEGAELDAYIGGARVLRDDHAPVDQLMLRG